jgi:hypothetical protein
MEYHSIQTIKPYPYTVEFKEKKFEPVEGNYYYFWDNNTETAIYSKYLGKCLSDRYHTDGFGVFDNVSETPPFK